MTEIVLLSPPGARFGPFMRENSYCAFLRLGDLDSREIGLKSTTEDIHSVLLREALEVKERALAMELAAQHRIEVKVRLQDYGINADGTNLPWLVPSRNDVSKVTTDETSGRRFDQ